MKCPACLLALDRSRYEGLPVLSCNGCNGYLVGTRRVSGINRRREKSPEDLKQESLIVGGKKSGDKDSVDTLRCPRCRQPMNKELWKGAATFHIDKCRTCELVWFDAGELARCQLDYEATPRAQESSRLQTRHREMTPQEQRQFEQNLARLPEGDATLASAFGKGFMECMAHLAWGWRRRQR